MDVSGAPDAVGAQSGPERLVRMIGLQHAVDVVRARRVAADLAGWLAWPAGPCARLDLVVAELAANVVAHGGGGALQIEAVRLPSPEITVVCTDVGKRSTGAPSQGLGLGLAVVTELANTFEVTRRSRGGTCARARLWV